MKHGTLRCVHSTLRAVSDQRQRPATGLPWKCGLFFSKRGLWAGLVCRHLFLGMLTEPGQQDGRFRAVAQECPGQGAFFRKLTIGCRPETGVGEEK